METENTTVAEPKTLGDPLSYLPCSKILEFRKKDVIFAKGQSSINLYLVISGKVTVCRPRENGRAEFLLDIYQTDEFFGESALIGQPHAETALALEEDTKVMAWSTTDVGRITSDRPKLAIALMQLVVQRSAEFANRIESFATESIQHRLARALIRFSDRFGHEDGNGAVQMMPFTHDLLSHYVGTSREIVSHYMKQFRSDGCVRDSRKAMVVYVDALKKCLRGNSGSTSSAEEPGVPAYPDAAAA